MDNRNPLSSSVTATPCHLPRWGRLPSKLGKERDRLPDSNIEQMQAEIIS